MTDVGPHAGRVVPPGAVLTPAAVARRLGIAVATLRSWDHRHGLGPSEHLAGRHRRYTADDVRRLERVVALVRQGVPVARAAEVVEATPIAEGEAGAAAVTDRALDRRLRTLREAADRLDAGAVRRLTVDLLHERGVVDTWQRLLVPLLVRLGERCGASGGPVEVEHLATDGIRAALQAMPTRVAAGPASVLLAGAPDEQHTLPLEALRLALAERGHDSVLLGARVPPESLLAAVRRLRPAHVVVWAHAQTLAERVPVDAVRALGARLLAAGPGWRRVELPSDVARPVDLGEAVGAIAGSG